jgi:putative ABC transport system ATP-binding protein
MEWQMSGGDVAPAIPQTNGHLTEHEEIEEELEELEEEDPEVELAEAAKEKRE